MKMSEDERAEAIEEALQEPVPVFLEDSSLQRIAYSLGINEKPQLVTDAQLDKIAGTSLYRTVHDVYDRANDISFKAQEIADQVRAGDFTRYSDNGGSAYGRGLYFANSYYGSVVYQQGAASQNIVMRAKYAPTARIVDYGKTLAGVRKEISSGTKLGRVL